MITETNSRIINQKHFQILAKSRRMIWIRSRSTEEEFIITDYNVRSKYSGERRGLQWSVYHRHCPEELCHYHANEKSFGDAMRHIEAHDRKVAWQRKEKSQLLTTLKGRGLQLAPEVQT